MDETREQLVSLEGSDLEHAKAMLTERWATRLADLLEEQLTSVWLT